MPDKIEKILKQIHLIFANGEPYKGSATDVVVNKKEVFELLEKLNYAVLEVMDAYEINELSKEQAIHRVQKDAQKIIDDASKSAEEIYNNVTSSLVKGRTNVVLMHDASNKIYTLEALDNIIDYCLEQGFELKAISQDTKIVQHNVNN